MSLKRFPSADRTSRRSITSAKSSILSAGSVEIEKKLLRITEQEEHELVVYSIREEIIKNCMDEIQRRYLEKQAVKFSVHCAHRALVQLLNYHFVNRDPGRPNYLTHPDWMPDQQIEPSTPDTWAAYKLPIRPKPLPSPLHLEPESISDMQESISTPSNVFETTKSSIEEESSELAVIYEKSISEPSGTISDFDKQFYRFLEREHSKGDEEEEEEEGGDESPIKLRRPSELSIFTKTAITTRKESLPKSLSLGFSKICDNSMKVQKLPNIFIDSQSSQSKHKLGLNIETLPPLRAEARYKPVGQGQDVSELQLKKP